uniref:TSC22 domain family member 2 n=1 Tax=Oryzias melastigma TaxID=30732 RepID=A0A3B3BJ47_ORYME
MSKMPAKKKSCFQITSVTQAQVAAVGQQPPPPTPGVSVTTSQPAAVTSAAPPSSTSTVSCSSRFRVIKLDHGTGEPFRRGRWTCTEFYEKDSEASHAGRTVDSIRHGSITLDPAADRDSGLGLTVGSPVLPIQKSPIVTPSAQPLVYPPQQQPLLPQLPVGHHQSSGHVQNQTEYYQPLGPATGQTLPVSRLSIGQGSIPVSGAVSGQVENAVVAGAGPVSAGQTALLGGAGGPIHVGGSIVPPSHPMSSVVQNVASGTNIVAIDNKIEQAMDLVKSHLMYAVREEVEVLKEQIKELYERNSVLERENAVLKSLANSEQLSQLATQSTPSAGAAPLQQVLSHPQPLPQHPKPQQPQPQLDSGQPNVTSA